MRIIAGKYKSRRIYSAGEKAKRGAVEQKSTYRPTSDRAKESLFNILNNLIDFESITCLDLFAGSGSLGFEAISRGAESCDFVDKSSVNLNNIERTAGELDISDNVNLINSDVLDFLEINADFYYDLIFADPPYNYDFFEVLCGKIFKKSFGIFVLEHPSGVNILYDTKRFDMAGKTIGTTNFKIFSTKE